MEDKKQVLSHFERISDVFSNIYEGEQNSFIDKLVDILFRKSILKRRKELIIRLSKDLTGKRVLDIGCGPGTYANGLIKKGAEAVLGIDISSAMIKLAKERTRRSGIEQRCRFEKLDFMKIDSQDKFDLIIAAGIFDYISEPGSFLLKVHQYLQDKAILSFPIKWSIMTPLRMLWLLKKRCPNFYYSKKRIIKLLNLNGFKIISIYRIGSFLVPGNYIVVCERKA